MVRHPPAVGEAAGAQDQRGEEMQIHLGVGCGWGLDFLGCMTSFEHLQGNSIRLLLGCVNTAGKLRQ